MLARAVPVDVFFFYIFLYNRALGLDGEQESLSE